MRILAATAALAIWAMPLAADEQVDRLMNAMHLAEFMEILSKEGQAQGRAMNESLLEGSGGAYFQAQVEDLYDPVAMHDQLSQSVGRNLSDAQLEQASIFFESDLGQTIVSLENSARRALADEAIEDMARAAYVQADRDDTFFRLVEEYVQVNDLIEKNVRGTLSADYSFYRGLAEGRGGLTDEAALLEELLSQQDDTKAETIEWMYAFLLLAYQPLNEAQMRENIAFSRTETGRALNKALFEGFDEMIDAISFRLGAAVARAMGASDL